MGTPMNEEYIEECGIHEEILLGIKQADEGKTIDGETVLKRLSEKYEKKFLQ